MAWLRFLVRLDFASQFSIEVGSMTEWVDNVLLIVLQQGRRSNANKIAVLLVPRYDLDKVWTG